MHRPERVQVPVRLLRRGDARDDRIQPFFQHRVRLDAQGVRRALDHLVRVRIVERVDRGGRVLERLFAGGAAPHGLGREVEVLQPVRLLALLQRKRNGHGPVDLLFRLPESAGDPHGGKWHRLDGIVGAEDTGGRRKGAQREQQRDGRIHRAEFSRMSPSSPRSPPDLFRLPKAKEGLPAGTIQRQPQNAFCFGREETVARQFLHRNRADSWTSRAGAQGALQPRQVASSFADTNCGELGCGPTMAAVSRPVLVGN